MPMFCALPGYADRRRGFAPPPEGAHPRGVLHPRQWVEPPPTLRDCVPGVGFPGFQPVPELRSCDEYPCFDITPNHIDSKAAHDSIVTIPDSVLRPACDVEAFSIKLDQRREAPDADCASCLVAPFRARLRISPSPQFVNSPRLGLRLRGRGPRSFQPRASRGPRFQLRLVPTPTHFRFGYQITLAGSDSAFRAVQGPFGRACPDQDAPRPCSLQPRTPARSITSTASSPTPPGPPTDTLSVLRR
jgi:hypothetical protein